MTAGCTTSAGLLDRMEAEAAAAREAEREALEARVVAEHTVPCEFCGAPRPPLLLWRELDGSRIRPPVVAGNRPCGCEGARDAAEKAVLAEEARRRREAAERDRRRLERAGVPRRFLAASHPEDGRWRDVAAGRGLYICGEVGTRKTTLASAVARRLLLEGRRRVLFTGDVAMMDAIRDTFSGSGRASEVVDRFSSVPVLVVDDLGKAPPTEWAISRVFQIVNARYEAMLPVVVTSQYSRGELIDRLARHGDEETATAVVSRLFEMTDTVRLAGGDSRLAAKGAAE